MIFYPFIQLIGFCAFLGPWTYYMLVVASTGESKTATALLFNSVTVDYTYYEYSDLSVYSFWYFLFELFWVYNFVIAMGIITLALSFSTWYFSPDKR